MKTEELQIILNNAPESATHYSHWNKFFYRKQGEDWMWCGFGSRLFQFVDEDDSVDSEIRSLADIREIVELRNREKDVYERIKPYDLYYGEVSIVIEEITTEYEERLKT